MTKVLIASPVRQKPSILREFLDSLDKLNTEGLEVKFVFVWDDDHTDNMKQLADFVVDHPCDVLDSLGGYCLIHDDDNPDSDPVLIRRGEYLCDDSTHHWTPELVSRVAIYKNDFLQYAEEWGADYCFLVDSDLVIHPRTLHHLLSLDKDIVSEIFWTSNFGANNPPLPNVWISGGYDITTEFLDMLRKPGVYQVGGLGACTLISRRAIQAGVSFNNVDNKGKDILGEDRDFCLRARVLGFELWCDTQYPCYHIYRDSELAGLPLYRDRQRERGSRITVGILAKNEADRYLPQVLEQAKKIADAIVVLDDASTDNTIQVVADALGIHMAEPIIAEEKCDVYLGDNRPAIPLSILACRKESGFGNEISVRKQLWNFCVAQGNDWIMILDADEILEDRAIQQLPRLAADAGAEAYAFRWYDFWDESHYRDDALWSAHRRNQIFMVRYVPGYDYQWLEQPLHCGRLPAYLGKFKAVVSDLRIKHMGWAREKDRQDKYNRYLAQDPEGKTGSWDQYQSILDDNPHLIEWQEPEVKPTVSLCMIVKDAEKTLCRCLNSVKDVVDEIIIVDTGSNDSTIYIAVEYGAKVVIHSWDNDFAAARNCSLDHATGDWILFLDADEELTPQARDMLHTLLDTDQFEGYFCTVTNLLPEKNHDVIFRLFRNRLEYRFEGPIHEQIKDSIERLNPAKICFALVSDFEILHYGYTGDQTDKVKRNLDIYDQIQIAEGDLLGHYHKGVELMRAERWDEAITEFIAATRGISTRQIFFPKLLRALVVSLYESHRPENALDIARLGILLFPDYADLFHFAGVSAYVLGDYAQAEQYLKRAIDCPQQPVNYGAFEGVKEKSQEVIDRINRERGLSVLDTCNLLPFYLSAYQARESVDIEADGKMFRMISPETVRREIKCREISR